MMTVGVIASEVSRVERRAQIDGEIPAGSKKMHVNLGQNILIAATTSSAEGKRHTGGHNPMSARETRATFLSLGVVLGRCITFGAH